MPEVPVLASAVGIKVGVNAYPLFPPLVVVVYYCLFNQQDPTVTHFSCRNKETKKGPGRPLPHLHDERCPSEGISKARIISHTSRMS